MEARTPHWRMLVVPVGFALACVTLIIALGEPPAGGHLEINNILYGSGISLKDCVLHFAIFVFHRESADTQFRAEEADACAIILLMNPMRMMGKIRIAR